MRISYLKIAGVVLIIIGCLFAWINRPSYSQLAQPDGNSQINKSEYQLISAKDGITALELLNNAVITEVKEYDFGTMITSIGGLEANKDNFWAFYLNGEMAKSAADKVILKSGDVIRFNYEKINDSKIE